VTLEKLKEKMLEDPDMKEMFSKHFPDLDFEKIVNQTIKQMYEYAVDKDYDVLDLSLDGVRAFFESVFKSDEEDEDEDDGKNYGKA
jgi:hypothetical protein